MYDILSRTKLYSITICLAYKMHVLKRMRKWNIP